MSLEALYDVLDLEPKCGQGGVEAFEEVASSITVWKGWPETWALAEGDIANATHR